MHGRIRLLIVAAFSLLLIATAPGCEGWQKGTGQPTQAEVDAAEAAFAAAERRAEEAEAAQSELARELERVRAANAAVAAQRDQLAQLQSRVAMELAHAPDAARPFLESQLDAIRTQRRAIDDQAAAFASTIARYETDLAGLAAGTAAAEAKLVAHATELDALARRAEEAQTRLTEQVRDAGQTLGQFVPGAGAVVGTVLDGMPWLLGLGAATFGATTFRARRRLAQEHEARVQAEQQRDGARKVVAITEKHGIEKIATDEKARAVARAEVYADPVAAAEFNAAKALARGVPA